MNANAFLAKVTVKKGVLEVFPTHPAWIEHLSAQVLALISRAS